MNRYNISILAIILLAIFAIVQSNSSSDAPGGKKVLAVLENSGIKSSHSIFFNSLEEKGYTIDYVGHEDRNIKFKKYGEWLYDNLIIFAPSASDITGITSDDVLDFIDAGKNVIIAADTDIGDFIKEIASECNVEYDEEGTNVIDHLNFDGADKNGDHTLIAADNFASASVIFKGIESPILFRGIGQDIEEDSELLFSLLSASSSAYSSSTTKPVKDLHVTGNKISLVSALQARNNARVLFSGSLELFGNKFFNAKVNKQSTDGKIKTFEKSGNENFVKQISSWTFQEKGVLRVVHAEHHRVNESTAPFSYTIKDEVTYTIEIEEWNGEKWVPYSANDVQLEYRMLDPYVRTTLKSNGKGKFSSTFILPDVYGVFTFKVEYSRKGLSNVNSILRIPVRPFRHNEYERFIESAYPYYASAFSMIVGIFIFSWVFLYHKEK